MDAHRAESGKKVKGKKAGLRKYPAIRSASYARVIIPHACLLQGKACKSKKRSKGKACKAKGLRRLRAISMASIPSSHEDELPANPDPSHLPKAKAKGAKKRKANTEVAEDTPAPVTKAPKRAPGKPKAGKGFEEPLATKSKPGKGKGKAGKKAAEKDNAKTGTGDGKKKRGEGKGKAAKHATPEEVEEKTPAKKGSQPAKPAKKATKPGKAARSEASDFPPQPPNEELVQSFTSILEECGELDYEDTGLDIHKQRFGKLGIRLNIYWSRAAVGITIKDPSVKSGKKDKVYFSTPTYTMATHLQAAQWVAPYLQDICSECWPPGASATL